MSSTEKCSLTLETHQVILSETFSDLRNTYKFSDVTLVCEDNQQIKAHKVILSASSSLLMQMLVGVNHSHPLLYFWDIKERDLAKIVDFIYNGQVEVYQSDLEEFIKIAGRLGIKGIRENYPRNRDQDLFVMEAKEDIEKENFQPAEIIEECSYQIAAIPGMKKCRKLKIKSCSNGKIKRSKLWKHFSAKEGAPNKATCNLCSKELSRGKEGHNSLGNKTLNNHLKSQHAEAFREYKEAKNSRAVLELGRVIDI